MRKFKVKVDGVAYIVKVEEITSESKSKPIEQNHSEIEVETTAQPSIPLVETTPSMLTGEITSPIQGTVVSVNVKSGDTVNKGDVVVVIEAMKMENDISSQISGTVKEVCVREGQTVKVGDVLLIIT